MKLIIAGCRDFSDPIFIFGEFQPFMGQVTEIVSGGAPGVDQCGEDIARRLGIPLKQFPADWSLGRKAGPIRNRQMAEYADELLAIWDGKSRGTRNMIETMEQLRKPCHIRYIGDPLASTS